MPPNVESFSHFTNWSHPTLASTNIHHQTRNPLKSVSFARSNRKEDKEISPFFLRKQPLIPELPPRQRTGTRASQRLHVLSFMTDELETMLHIKEKGSHSPISNTNKWGINRGKSQQTNFNMLHIFRSGLDWNCMNQVRTKQNRGRISVGNRASDVWIQLHRDMLSCLERLKKFFLTSSRQSIPTQFNLWCNCPHVSRSSHVGNEICNYKLDKECSLTSESYWHLLATLRDISMLQKAVDCAEDYTLQFCWKYAPYHFKINVEQL
jgi:hypothetical protein